MRVQFSSLEDVRRVLFSALNGIVTSRQQSRLASVIAATLRDAGLLGSSVEQHYSAAQVASLLGRSPAWVVKHAKLSHFGPVSWDDGLLIPASGVNAYLDEHRVSSLPEKAGGHHGLDGEENVLPKRRAAAAEVVAGGGDPGPGLDSST